MRSLPDDTENRFQHAFVLLLFSHHLRGIRGIFDAVLASGGGKTSVFVDLKTAFRGVLRWNRNRRSCQRQTDVKHGSN